MMQSGLLSGAEAPVHPQAGW